MILRMNKADLFPLKGTELQLRFRDTTPTHLLAIGYLEMMGIAAKVQFLTHLLFTKKQKLQPLPLKP